MQGTIIPEKQQQNVVSWNIFYFAAIREEPFVIGSIISSENLKYKIQYIKHSQRQTHQIIKWIILILNHSYERHWWKEYVNLFYWKLFYGHWSEAYNSFISWISFKFTIQVVSINNVCRCLARNLFLAAKWMTHVMLWPKTTLCPLSYDTA